MLSSVPRQYRRLTERFVAGHRVTLLRNGEEAFPSMLAAIDTAERQVLLEMYWFGSDTIGRRFASALSKAAERGVQVGVIYDSLGSIEADSRMFDEMRRSGVQVLEFNPIMPWRKRFRLENASVRDHRKILVVDGKLGFTGGLNISDYWLPEHEGGGGWRDDVVRIEGPAVEGFVRCFRNTWRHESDKPLGFELESSPLPQGTLAVRVLGSSMRQDRPEIVRAYLFHIYRAHKRIWLANSYFVPDGRITRALLLAGLRGVDVRVLLPGKSDVEVVRLAGKAIYEKLLAAGVRIYEWQANVLHSKTAVIDGEWSTIGSLNLEYRSLFSSREINVAILDPGFARVMEASYLADLEQSVELDPASFEKRGFSERLLEQTLYRFRSLL